VKLKKNDVYNGKG